MRGSAFGQRIAAEMAALRPAAPGLTGYTKLPESRWSALLKLSPEVTVGFDRSTGAIVHLTRGNNSFASTSNTLADIWYKTNDRAEELSMSANYSVTIPDPWGGGGLGVRNWPHDSSANLSESKVWRPALRSMYTKSSGAKAVSAVLLELAMPAQAVTQYGCPKTVWVSVALAVGGGSGELSTVNVTVVAMEKRGTRLPEQMWVGFSPLTGQDAATWQMDKMGTRVSFGETVKNGSKYLHGVGGGGVTLEASAQVHKQSVVACDRWTKLLTDCVCLQRP